MQMGGGTRTALGDPSSLLSGIGGEGGGAKVRVQETFQKKFRSGNEEYGPPAGGGGGSVRRPLLLAAGMAGVGAASHWLAEAASAAAPSSHCPAGGADCPASPVASLPVPLATALCSSPGQVQL